MPLCPICRQPMVQVEEAEVCAASCPNCRGTWISGQALQRRTRLETTPGQPHTELPPLADLADTVTHSDSTAPLACPDCRRIMIKERFHPNIPVQIDRCEPCGHIWLDAGEQGLLLSLYREMVASQPAPVPGQQERLDRLQQMQTQTQNPSTFTSGSSGPSGAEVAANVGSAIFSILIDLLLSSGRSHRRYW